MDINKNNAVFKNGHKEIKNDVPLKIHKRRFLGDFWPTLNAAYYSAYYCFASSYCFSNTSTRL